MTLSRDGFFRSILGELINDQKPRLNRLVMLGDSIIQVNNEVLR